MSNITLEIKDKIAIVTLDKKPLNVCNRFFYTEIKCFMEALNGRDDYDVVVLRSGCKHFCAGGDLQEINDIINKCDHDFSTLVARSCSQAMGSIINCKKPVIAAVNGKAVGAGTAIAASCDVIIADEDAVFSIPEITVGIIGAAEFLELLIPRRLARYYVLTGKPITAQEMKTLGGILDVVPKDNLLERAIDVAREISRLAPMSVSLFKQCLNDNDNERLNEKYMHGAELGFKFHCSNDAKETIAAILEKRKPSFSSN
jgi:enoyl-CoA hydratase